MTEKPYLDKTIAQQWEAAIRALDTNKNGTIEPAREALDFHVLTPSVQHALLNALFESDASNHGARKATVTVASALEFLRADVANTMRREDMNQDGMVTECEHRNWYRAAGNHSQRR
jgi:hypothetical protein